MSRKSSGLRNRHRRGVGTYSKAGKSRQADRYGKYNAGRRIEDEKIGRHLRNVDSETVEVSDAA